MEEGREDEGNGVGGRRRERGVEGGSVGGGVVRGRKGKGNEYAERRGIEMGVNDRRSIGKV